MLALSLQNEGQASSMVEQGFWESVPEADPARAGPTSLGDIKGKFASFFFLIMFYEYSACLYVHVPYAFSAMGG